MERINRGDYISLVGSLLGKGEAVVLTGHRRAGKSCILELLAAELSDKGNVIYIDMENLENADLKTFRELSEKDKGGRDGRSPQLCADRRSAGGGGV